MQILSTQLTGEAKIGFLNVLIILQLKVTWQYQLLTTDQWKGDEYVMYLVDIDYMVERVGCGNRTVALKILSTTF